VVLKGKGQTNKHLKTFVLLSLSFRLQTSFFFFGPDKPAMGIRYNLESILTMYSTTVD
jgi:hypothetical protein